MATPLKAFDFRLEPASENETISFIRESEASYYGSDGLLHFSVKGQTLLASSKSFITNWNKVGTAVSIPGNILGADGSSSASKIIENGATGEHRFSQTVVVTKGVPVTISIYLKAGTRDKVQFSFQNSASYTGGNPGIKFNLSTGKLLSKSSNVISYEAVNNGNGWWKLKLTGLPDLDTKSGMHVYILNDNNTISYNGGGSERYLYSWGAEIEQGSPVSEVVTTGLRYNYDLSGSSPKLLGALIEPASTNMVLYSQLMTHSAWRKQYATITTPGGKAPDGSATVFKIKESTTNSQHYIMPYPVIPAAIGGVYTFSAFMKASERRWAFFNLNGVTCHFDLANGRVGNRHSLYTNVGIESAGNGWYRCTATFKSLAVLISAKIGPEQQNGEPSYRGDGNSGVLVWGAQLERATQMTSYIRTTGTRASRSADIVTLTRPNETGQNDIFVQRSSGGVWLNNVSDNLPLSASADEVELVHFYDSDISVTEKDQTTEKLFPPKYANVGPSNTLVSVFGTTYMAQTPNKEWNLQRAYNKTSPVFKFQLNSGDTWSGDASNPKKKERVELYMKNADLPYNRDVWISYAIKIAPGEKLTLDPIEWCLLGQVHATEDPGEMSTGPMLGIRLEDMDRITVYTASTLENPIRTAPKYIFRGSSQFTRGVWHKVVFRMRFSPTNGQLQWWHNGQEKLNLSNIGLGYPDVLGPYWKFGIYRSAMTQTVAVEFANMELDYNNSLFSRVAQPLVIA